jgi:hypothetical protein
MLVLYDFRCTKYAVLAVGASCYIFSDIKVVNVHLDEETFAVMTVSVVRDHTNTKLGLSGQLCDYLTFICFENSQILENIQYKLKDHNAIHRSRRSLKGKFKFTIVLRF